MTIQIPAQEQISVSKLKVDGENPNRMTPKQLERLKSSIEKYGFIVPIITNKDLLVADGEQRLTAAQQLQMNMVPVIRLPIEDVDRRLLRQVLNKLRGEYELVADALEFEKIINQGYEDELKHLLDLSDSQLERYLSEIREPKEESYEIPEIDKIKTDIQRGDIIKLGTHRLMCGDATCREDVEVLMDGQKADMVFTDPPYRLRNKKFGAVPSQYGGLDSDKVFHYNTWIPHASEFSKPASSILIFETWYNVRELWDEVAKYYEIENMIIWHVTNRHYLWWKPKHFTNRYDICIYAHRGESVYNFDGTLDDVIESPAQSLAESGTAIHFGGKPVKILVPYIHVLTNNPNIVLDLFGGSGSTLIACEQTGRRCFMMEIDPRYCQVIVDRWESYTGQKASKVN